MHSPCDFRISLLGMYTQRNSYPCTQGDVPKYTEIPVTAKTRNDLIAIIRKTDELCCDYTLNIKARKLSICTNMNESHKHNIWGGTGYVPRYSFIYNINKFMQNNIIHCLGIYINISIQIYTERQRA